MSNDSIAPEGEPLPPVPSQDGRTPSRRRSPLEIDGGQYSDVPLPLRAEEPEVPPPPTFPVSSTVSMAMETSANLSSEVRVPLTGAAAVASAVSLGIEVLRAPDAETRVAELLRQVAELETALQRMLPLARALDEFHQKRAHNRPPELVEIERLPTNSASAIDDAILCLDAIRNQIALERQSPTTGDPSHNSALWELFARILERATRIAVAILGWVRLQPGDILSHVVAIAIYDQLRNWNLLEMAAGIEHDGALIISFIRQLV